MNTFWIVILSLICIFICCAFTGDSYQKSKPGNEKRKSEVSSSYHVIKHRRKPSHSRPKRKSFIVIRIREALWRKLKNLKPLFSDNEEHCIPKEVKGNALASKGKSCRPETTITAENACHDLSVWNVAKITFAQSERFLRRYNLPPETKFIGTSSILTWGKGRVLPTDFVFTLEWFFFSFSFYSFIYLRCKS